MKAAYYIGNKTFECREGSVDPVEQGMVKIKVAFCGICGTDIHIFHGNMDKRVDIPQIIGHEVSGEVVEVANDVTNVNVGDRVAVRPLLPGVADPSDNGQLHIGKHLKFIGIDTPGGMQSYWNVPAFTLHKLPFGMPLHIGALIEPLAVACHDVRRSNVQEGENVVVLGGGPIGVLIALVAKHKKANVLLSEPNAGRIEKCRSLGIKTINPAEQDLVNEVEAFTKGAMADVVFEVAGVQATTSLMTELARARGRIVMVAIHPKPQPIDLFKFFWRELSLIGVRVYEPTDFEDAINIAASGQLPLEEVITKIFSIQEIQSAFETIDNNPSGIKYLLNLQ